MTPTPHTPSVLRSLLLVTLLSSALGCDADDPDLADGELLFGLTPAQVELIHETYLPDEDLAATRARLTAPFDCDLYDDMCEAIGREAAIDITARQVDLALAGVGPEEMATQLRGWFDDAAQAWSAAESADPGAEQFRNSYGPWAIRTKDGTRLKVRNYILTPLFGDREAWTQVRLEIQDGDGNWLWITADQLCVNTGVNTQVEITDGDDFPYTEVVLESEDPGKACVSGALGLLDFTYHDRLFGWSVGSLWQYYVMTADGCGTGTHNGVFLGICAEPHSRTF